MTIVRKVLSLTGAVLVPLSMGAQPLGKIVVTPYVGFYAPSTEVAKMNSANDGSTFAASAEHRAGLALGATGSYWLAPRAALEINALYAWSNLRSNGAITEPGIPFDSFSETEHAGVILAAAKFMYGLFPASSDFQLRLGAGPAIISRVGTAYKSDAGGSVTGKTDFGGAVSLCTKVPIANGVAMRLRVEDFMYQAKLGWKDKLNPSESMNFGKRFQHDLVLSVGLQIGLIR